MSEITIIGFDISTFVRTTRMAAVEKGVSHELTPGPLQSPGDLKEPPFLALNPLGRMPVMQHGDFTLFETAAIVGYIDRAFEGPALIPADPKAAALTSQWMGALGTVFDQLMTRGYVIPNFFPGTEDGKPDPARIEAALPGVRRCFEILEAALADGPYFVGGALTAADLFLPPVLEHLSHLPESGALLAESPNTRRAFEAAKARPSYAATLPERYKEAA